ncbi:hypothetical protein SteCoe_32955 [Stentor coeruleus]|uniref:Uncharacterized protein n=1 Tax=Stentor coeruleus TaxID=5963 RepID=A0A1R2AXU9_9CILI|nr:hypothetical protein SteCoe_32955 [Stentor coeruleus]
MMDSYHLSVVKIEGIREVTNSYCYIYLGNNILRVLTLECFDVQPIPISKGTLRFVVEDSRNSKTLATLSFTSKAFKRIGFHWMPMFTDNEQCLNEVPEEVGLPRILFDVQANILSPVQELTEESETVEETSEEQFFEDLPRLKAKIMIMSMKISELEQHILTQKRIFDEEVEMIHLRSLEKANKLEEQVKVLQETISKYEENIFGLNKDIIGLKGNLEEAQTQKEQLEKKIEKVVDEAKVRENSILVMLQQKDLEIFALNMKLKKTKEFEICRLGGFGINEVKKQKMSSFGVWTENNFETFNCLDWKEEKHQILEILDVEEVEDQGNKGLRQKCAEMSKTENLCVYSIGRQNSKTEESVQLLNMIKEKDSLSRKLFEAETKISNFKLKTLQEIDNKVKKFLSSRKLDNFAIVCNELVYSIANKKVIVFMKNDVIHCKIGSSVKKLECFIRDNCSHDVENFKKKQVNNGGLASHKRFYTSLEFDKITNSLIHKTFDGSIRAKSNKRMTKNSNTPTRRQAFSPAIRNITTR